MIENKKKSLGQFFTKSDVWLKPHIRKFIDDIPIKRVVDPFAGGGHLMDVFSDDYEKVGYDIDSTLDWEYNDSLLSIPYYGSSGLCVTNPPYLGKSSSSRSGIKYANAYFEKNKHCDDLYLIALERCFDSFDFGVAIIPETYILHKNFSSRVNTVTILEDNPFSDTDCPVIVITWVKDPQKDVFIYKNSSFLGMKSLFKSTIPKGSSISERISFNEAVGNLGVICIDGASGNDPIRFCKSSDIKKEIKATNRSFTIIKISSDIDENSLVDVCNDILNTYRNLSHDIFLAPFKGNDKTGKRRRRLDFITARKIIETAISQIKNYSLTFE